MPECKSTHCLLYQESFAMKRLSAELNCTFNNPPPDSRCGGSQIPQTEGPTNSEISQVYPLTPSVFLKINVFSLLAQATKITNKVGL